MGSYRKQQPAGYHYHFDAVALTDSTGRYVVPGTYRNTLTHVSHADDGPGHCHPPIYGRAFIDPYAPIKRKRGRERR